MKASAQSLLSSCAPTGDSLTARLQQHSEAGPARAAIVTPESTLSFAELAQRVLAQAQQLGEAGITSHSIVGIRCADDLQHFLHCLALIHIGATSFSVPTYESPQVQESVIGQCHATHVVDASEVKRVSLVGHSDILPASEARLLFSTSGTTGTPKQVVHHDSDLVAQAHRHIGSQSERFTCLASMEHNFAKRHRLYCLAAGATNVFLDSQPETLIDQCHAQCVNVLHVSAFQAQELLAIPNVGSLSRVRLKLGGSHVPAQLRQQLRAKITGNLQAGYGTTETGAISFTDPDDTEAGESVGRPLPGIDVRVVDSNRKPLKNGARGELVIRCEGIFRGYLGNPELTATRLAGGWFHTGDIGYLDSEQRIHLCGRSDDMFTFNSMNIYPQDIESRICEFPGVTEALVVPRVSAVHGNIPVAFVVFDKNVTPDLPTLKSFVTRHVGARSPRQFASVQELPRNASGKVSRHAAMDLPEKSEQVRRLMLDALRSHTTKRLKPAAIAAFIQGDADIPLGGTGLDSLARMEMLVAIEVEYGVVITPAEFSEFKTFGDISSRVLSSPTREVVKRSSEFPDIDQTRLSGAEAYALRFFRRVFDYCPTVAQLNKALSTMEHRLTPLEFTFLRELHLDDRLLPQSTAQHFQGAVTTWLQKFNHLMRGSGKQCPEPFVRHRIAPSVLHFVGPGSPTDKTLLICFAPKAGRQLTVPNAVLMQHTDSACYDLLVIADSARESYRLGIPLLGRNIDEVIGWLGRLPLIRNYSATRTIGCSAGAFLAVIAGYRLSAGLAVSVAGRFHAERYPHRILGRLLATWQTVRKSDCSRVLMCYPADKGKSRDRTYARIIARLTGGSLVGLQITDEVAGHHFLQRLAERGELAQFLDQTVFADAGSDILTTDRANVVFSLPAGQFRSFR